MRQTSCSGPRTPSAGTENIRDFGTTLRRSRWLPFALVPKEANQRWTKRHWAGIDHWPLSSRYAYGPILGRQSPLARCEPAMRCRCDRRNPGPSRVGQGRCRRNVATLKTGVPLSATLRRIGSNCPGELASQRWSAIVPQPLRMTP
jgi:hypothetical protein